MHDQESAWRNKKMHINSKQEEACNMNYVGDWRNLIAERGDKGYSVVIFRNFKATQYRDDLENEITYEQALEENLILNEESSKFFESLVLVTDIQLSV